MSEKPATHVTFAIVDGQSVELGRYTTSQAARRAGKRAVEKGEATDFAVSTVEQADAADEVLDGIEQGWVDDVLEPSTEEVEEIAAKAAEDAEEAGEAAVIDAEIVEVPTRKHETLKQAQRRIAAERRVEKLMEALADGPTEIEVHWPVADFDEMTGTRFWEGPAIEVDGKLRMGSNAPRPAVKVGRPEGGSAGRRNAAQAVAEADESWPMVQVLQDGAWVDVRPFGKRSAIRKVASLQGQGKTARAMLKGEQIAG